MVLTGDYYIEPHSLKGFEEPVSRGDCPLFTELLLEIRQSGISTSRKIYRERFKGPFFFLNHTF